MDELLFILADLKNEKEKVTYGDILEEYKGIFGIKSDYSFLIKGLESLERKGVVSKELGIYYRLDRVKDLQIPQRPNLRNRIYLLANFLKSKMLNEKWSYPKQYWKRDYYMGRLGGYIQ